MNLEELLRKLSGVEKRGKAWIALCPAHDDTKPSLSVSRSAKDPSKAVTHCFAGCTNAEVMAALQGGSAKIVHTRRERTITTLATVVRIPETEPLQWLADYTTLSLEFLQSQDINFSKPGKIGYKFNGSSTIKWRHYGGRQQKGDWQSNGEGQPPLWPTLPDHCSEVVFLGAGETDALCLRAALEESGVDAFALTKGEGHVPDGAIKELQHRGAQELVYVPDLDGAGQKAIRGLTVSAEKHKLKFTTIDLTEHLDESLGEKDVRDLTRKIGIVALREVLEEAYTEGPRPLALSAIAYAAQAPKQINWICEPWLAVGTSTLIAGFAKAGKTTFLFKLMREMANGGEVLGHAVERGKALVWTENSAIAWRYKCDKFLGGFPGHVYVIPRDEEALIGHSFEENARLILSEAHEKGCTLVVMDSLAGLAGFEDSNDQAEISRSLIPLNRLCRKYGVALAMIHHLNKAGSSPAGSFVFQAEPDTLVEMKGEYNEPRTIKVKGRLFIESPPDLTFKMNRETGEYEETIEPAFGLLNALPRREDEAITLRELAERLDLEFDAKNRFSLKRALDKMIEEGSARSTGEEGRGKVKKYFAVTLKPSIRRVK